MDWNEILAVLINSVLVLMAVQFIKTTGIPWLKANTPWALPLIAVLVGPIMTYLTGIISSTLGYPVDLSPIAGLFAGMAAVVMHQVGKQAEPRKRL